MALHCSIEKIRDHQELTEDEHERRITESCCWGSLVYGIGRITAPLHGPQFLLLPIATLAML